MKNILVPLELKNDQIDQQLVDSAIQLAIPFKAKCWVVHVAPPDPEFVGYEIGPQYIRDELALEFRTEHKKLQAYSEKIKDKGSDAEGLMIQGATAEMIEEEIKKLKIDLVILGNRKYGFWEVLFKGSLKDELIEEIQVPILLIPHT